MRSSSSGVGHLEICRLPLPAPGRLHAGGADAVGRLFERCVVVLVVFLPSGSRRLQEGEVGNAGFARLASSRGGDVGERLACWRRARSCAGAACRRRPGVSTSSRAPSRPALDTWGYLVSRRSATAEQKASLSRGGVLVRDDVDEVLHRVGTQGQRIVGMRVALPELPCTIAGDRAPAPRGARGRDGRASRAPGPCRRRCRSGPSRRCLRSAVGSKICPTLRGDTPASGRGSPDSRVGMGGGGWPSLIGLAYCRSRSPENRSKCPARPR